MNVLSSLWSALRSLADNLSALSATVAEANGRLRLGLRLEEPPRPEDVDHTANGFLPPPAPPAPRPEPEEKRRKGRQAQVAAQLDTL
jgi:hypothetical protein